MILAKINYQVQIINANLSYLLTFEYEETPCFYACSTIPSNTLPDST